MAINPGKTKTIGIPGVLGGTTRQLTLDDAEALERVPGVETVVPVVMGAARSRRGERGRSVIVYGVTPTVPDGLAHRRARRARFLPRGTRGAALPLAVLGPTLDARALRRAKPARRARADRRRSASW